MSSLLGRIAAGDAEAMQQCIDRYGSLVWSIARRLIGGRGEAEDAVQDVFIDIWKSAPRFDATLSSEKSFVVMIARRRIIDRLRKSTRRVDTVGVDEQAHEPAGDEHREIERSAEASIAARALAELRPERRRVIEMAVYEGMSHREISEATEMPLGTVKSHITRGLAHVRDCLLTPARTAE